MTLITKDNLSSFVEYYHNFHDSYITNINYDIKNSKIKLSIDVCWSGKPKLKEDETYETNKTKLIIIFNNVNKCNIKEMFSWDFIYNTFIKFIKMENKEFICFANDEEDPSIYIICDNIEYEDEKINTY